MPVGLTERLVALVRNGLPAGERVGVALSGGGDSTALLHLCREAGLPVEAVTVDHGLRPDSAAEALEVAGWCQALGVPHQIAVWEHGTVEGNLMDAARRARMLLIREWATRRGIGTVVLGHTQDDQAETVLMGLGRGAGLAGLSGMRPDWVEAGVRFCRPLLGAGRRELRDWLQSRGIGWIDDPTNENDRFTRIKARKTLAALAPLGISAGSLARVARNLAGAQETLEALVEAIRTRHVQEEAGALRLAPDLFHEPLEAQRLIVQAALGWLSGAAYPPRAEAVERLVTAMAAGRDATLAGCRFRNGWLMREPRAVGEAVAVGALWDGRWLVEGPPGEVRALGPAGLKQALDWRRSGLPRDVLLISPAVWDGAHLLAAPVAGLSAEWRARLQRPFTLRR